MALIFTASTDLMSAEHTSRFLVPFLRWLKPDITWETIGQIHFLIRKGAHLTEYAILAVLLWRALRHRRSNVRGSLWPQAAIALAMAIIFAATDEYHQALVPTRGSSSIDVLIDSCGAAAGIMIRWLVAVPNDRAQQWLGAGKIRRSLDQSAIPNHYCLPSAPRAPTPGL